MASQISVRTCTCSNAYQDTTYGKQNRVFNRFTKGWRCTVCGKETIVSEPKEEKAAAK